MGFIRVFLIIIEVIVCLLLIGVILLQKSRDSGLGMAFGAGMGESLFGAQAGNVLTRITVILAAVFLVNTTLLAFIHPIREESLVDRMLPDTGPPAPSPQTRPAGEGVAPVTPFDFGDAPAPAPLPDAGAVPVLPPVDVPEQGMTLPDTPVMPVPETVVPPPAEADDLPER